MNGTDKAFAVGICDSALAVIITEAQRSEDGLETGGILLGRTTENGESIVLVAGTPGPAALREPSRFLRDLHHAQVLAGQAWESERAQWIGEWHTHPSGHPIPSSTDMASYVRHLRDPELGFMQFLSIIVVIPKAGAPTLTAWRITPQGAHTAAVNILSGSD